MMKKLSLFVLTSLCVALLNIQQGSCQQANLKAGATTFNFGKINELGGPVSCCFEIRNTGSEPVIFANVRASCGCVTPTWTIDPINPGEVGYITATYDPMGRPGFFQKTLTINVTKTSSNNKTELFKLSIAGEVLPQISDKNENAGLLAFDGSIRKMYVPSSASPQISNESPKTATEFAKDIVDTDIPVNATNNDHTFAVIIGNENYQMVAGVPFATNDAQIFAQYCQKTLGLPENNVRLYTDVTYGKMLSAIKDIKAISAAYKGDISIIFFYAGHGVPNENSKDAFLLPIDADGTETEVCMPLSRLYNDLANLNVNNVIVLLDACFSGAQRGEGMLASARGVAIKTKPTTPQGNMVILSAASGDETAYPYKEKGHGLFTYFLLKKLQETRGNISLQALGDYIITNVMQQSIVVNRKSQTPCVTPASAVADSWQSWKLR